MTQDLADRLEKARHELADQFEQLAYEARSWSDYGLKRLGILAHDNRTEILASLRSLAPAPADQSDAGRDGVIEEMAKAMCDDQEGYKSAAGLVRWRWDSVGEESRNYWRKNARSAFRALANALASVVGRGEIEALAARFRAAGIHGWAIDALKDLQPLPTADSGWKCGADRYGVDPQDCNWPYCGCDPLAEKVMTQLAEHGWRTPDEVRNLLLQIPSATDRDAIREALKEAWRCLMDTRANQPCDTEATLRLITAALALIGEEQL